MAKTVIKGKPDAGDAAGTPVAGAGPTDAAVPNDDAVESVASAPVAPVKEKPLHFTISTKVDLGTLNKAAEATRKARAESTAYARAQSALAAAFNRRVTGNSQK